MNKTTRLDENNTTIRMDENSTIRLDSLEENKTTRLDENNTTIRMDENIPQETIQHDDTFLNYKIIESDIDKKAGGEADIFLIEYQEQTAFVKWYRSNIKIQLDLLKKLKRISNKYKYFPKIYEIGKEKNRIYEIQEFLDGGSLKEKLKTNKENIKKEINKFIETLSIALNILHKENIIHRDLKPDNILYRGNELVLSDFGASTKLDTELSRRLTGARGTVDYFAPEVVARDTKGKAVIGNEVDWWSLGIIILEILDIHPFEGMHEGAIFNVIVNKPIDIPESLDERYQLLLKGLLTKNPKKRWGYKEIKEWLEGKSPDIYYETSITDEEFKLEFNGKKYLIEEIAVEVLKKENFESAIKYFDKEFWDGNLKNERNPYRSKLVDIFDLETAEEKLIFFSYTILKANNKEIPFSLYGREITDNYIINLLQNYLNENISDEIDKKIINLIEDDIFSSLVQIYNNIYNKEDLKIAKFLPNDLEIENVHELLNICANYFNKNEELVKLLLKYIAIPENCNIELLSDNELYEIAKNNELNKNNENYKLALIANGYINDVKELVKEVKDEYLQIAFRYSQIEIIYYFLELGANPNIDFYDIDGNSLIPILFAIINQDIELLNILIKKGADLNKETSDGIFSLVKAVNINNKDIINILLNNSIDINKIQSNFNINALMDAVITENIDIVELLLKNKADPNIKCGQYIRTPLHEAVIRKNIELVKILLKNKADPNIAQEDGLTPLMDAVINENIDIVELLLKYKADPNIAQEDDGLTPLMSAVIRENIDIVELLLKYKADLNIKCGEYIRTPLHEAVIRKNIELVKILLKNKADPNIAQEDGLTPLMIAVIRKNIELVKLLLKYKANISDGLLSYNYPNKELEKIIFSNIRKKTNIKNIFQILLILIFTILPAYIFSYRYLLMYNHKRHFYTYNKKIFAKVPEPLNQIILKTLPLNVKNKLLKGKK